MHRFYASSAYPIRGWLVHQGMGAITDVYERDRLEAARERVHRRSYRRERLIENAPLLAGSGAVLAFVAWVAATR